MGKKSKKNKKKQSSGPPADGSQRMGKARKRGRMVIFAIVAIVALGWLAVILGMLFGGGGTPAPPTPG